MRDPREFPKVLIAVTVSEMIVFSLAGGNHVLESGPIYHRYHFRHTTIIMLGVIYASITS